MACFLRSLLVLTAWLGLVCSASASGVKYQFVTCEPKDCAHLCTQEKEKTKKINEKACLYDDEGNLKPDHSYLVQDGLIDIQPGQDYSMVTHCMNARERETVRCMYRKMP